MSHISRARQFLSVAAAAVLVAACGVGGDGTTSTQPTGSSLSSTSTTTPTTTVETTTTIRPTTTSTAVAMTGQAVYFLLQDLDEDDGSPGPFLVPVYREAPTSTSPAEAALDLLLEGPTDEETAGVPGISTAIPEGTSLLGITIENQTATVDLSGTFDDGGGSFGMFARLAQVVYTVTRAADVDEVVFSIDGEKVTVFSAEGIELDGPQQREDFYDMLPPVFVDSPAWGEPVTSPIQVQGLSNVFEAVSQLMLTDDDGEPLDEQTVMATCGTGCWGEWDAEIHYTLDRDQFGALIVWEVSAKDGSRVNIREYPVQLG